MNVVILGSGYVAGKHKTWVSRPSIYSNYGQPQPERRFVDLVGVSSLVSEVGLDRNLMRKWNETGVFLILQHTIFIFLGHGS